MIKVHILTKCSRCEGKAYLPDREITHNSGETYLAYKPCPVCQGSGIAPAWITLNELQDLLLKETCQHGRTTIHGGMHFTEGEVWDDFQEVCDECGKVLG